MSCEYIVIIRLFWWVFNIYWTLCISAKIVFQISKL